MAAKMAALQAIYRIYGEWVERLPLVCRKGCAACCTGSVTMTTLEGGMILDFVERKGWQQWLAAKLAGAKPGNSMAAMTTNEFAEACLNQREIDEATLGCWDLASCVFLEDDSCPIYEVRPFGCRSFGSLVTCAAGTAAEMAPIHLALNTVFTQIIEHLSSDGANWSTMVNILHSLVESAILDPAVHLLPARPVPGFLLEPREVKVLRPMLEKLSKDSSAPGMFGDLIDNFLPI